MRGCHTEERRPVHATRKAVWITTALRIDIRKERDDVTALVVDLLTKLDPQGRRPVFQYVVTTADHLGELIGVAQLLLVIDDLWQETKLLPFLLRGGKNCARLVTTRLPQVLPRSARSMSSISRKVPTID